MNTSQPHFAPTPYESPSDQQVIASTSSPESQKFLTKKRLLFSVFFVFVTLGGVVGFFSLRSSTMPPAPQTVPPAVNTEQPSPQITSFQSPLFIGTQTIVISDVRGGQLSGNATLRIDSTTISRSVEASLPPPPDGQFYQAWIGKVLETESDFVPLGQLVGVREGSYSLTRIEPLKEAVVSSDQIYDTLVVSLETIDDQIMEIEILEGSFTF